MVSFITNEHILLLVLTKKLFPAPSIICNSFHQRPCGISRLGMDFHRNFSICVMWERLPLSHFFVCKHTHGCNLHMHNQQPLPICFASTFVPLKVATLALHCSSMSAILRQSCPTFAASSWWLAHNVSTCAWLFDVGNFSAISQFTP